jgi:hypothetical protein
MDFEQQVELEVEKRMNKYQATSALCLATCLSAPPLRFGNKRVCDLLELFFDQMEGLNIGTISENQVIEEASRLGVNLKYENNKIIICLENTNKKKG